MTSGQSFRISTCHEHKNKSKIASGRQTGMKYLSLYLVDKQITPVNYLQTKLRDL